MPLPARAEFIAFARAEGDRTPGRALAIPLAVHILDDQLTPVLAYRRLVAPDERTAPSFLLESVEGGERQGRHSILSAQPAIEVVAREGRVVVTDHRRGGGITDSVEPNPLDVPRRISANIRLVRPPGVRLPACFLGGWVGYAAYDSVRYAEPGALPWTAAPTDDRGLPDLHFAFYDSVVVFDHVDKLVSVVRLVQIAPGAAEGDVAAAYDAATAAVERRLAELQAHVKPLASGRIGGEGGRGTAAAPAPLASNLSRAEHAAMLARAMEYIRAGDVFQVVLGQRFQKRSLADPFDVYRALRAVAFCLNHLLLKCLWTPAATAGFLASFAALAAAHRAGTDWESPDALEARAAALLPGLFLARIDGKSPAEYVTDARDKDRVRRVARAFLLTPTPHLATIRAAWAEELAA